MYSYLKYPLLVVLWMVALMSGALSIFREVYGLYSGVIPARSLFWSCAWVAFVFSAAISWVIEHKEKLEAEKRADTGRPRLTLKLDQGCWYTEDNKGFAVCNLGERPAFDVQVEPIPSTERLSYSH